MFEDRGYRSRSATKGKTVVLWFRNDLRVHDNKVLSEAQDAASSILPCYIFDPRAFRKVRVLARRWDKVGVQSRCGFGRVSPFKAHFILECVKDLRRNLEELGSKLFIRIGHPEKILPSLAQQLRATAVFCQEETSKRDLNVRNHKKLLLNEMRRFRMQSV